MAHIRANVRNLIGLVVYWFVVSNLSRSKISFISNFQISNILLGSNINS